MSAPAPSTSTPTSAPLGFVPNRSELPLDTKFTLGQEITDEQKAFLETNGFLHFRKVASQEEVERIIAEVDKIQEQWLAEKRTSVFGIPVMKGNIDGKEFIQRFGFTSVFSEYIKTFVRDDRFTPVRRLIGENTRVGDQEKDGVVFNRYINIPGSAYPDLGWHTDGLRDIFYLRMPKQMLNIGMHFDYCTKETGGLRLIPGSHTQGFFGMAFGKIYYDNRPDPREIAVETEPGDLTIHDGRLWHRVQRSPYFGAKSLRRSMYVPYLTDEYQPKDEKSSTPLYHHVLSAAWKLRAKYKL
jgi:ectoine hydroxylase-related dioxygenase (phytanoyl-CoA dioxygenase family)